jgi:hypothetical protein
MHNPIPEVDLIEESPWIVNDTHKVPLNILFKVVYACKKCGELNFLTPHAFRNISDLGAECEKCETINTMTLETGELKKQEKFVFFG